MRGHLRGARPDLLKVAAIGMLLVGLAVLTTRLSAAPPAEALATGDELHKMFDDAQYQPLLQKLARVLQLKGEAARPYDRVDLETLRADTLLQLKQQGSAVQSANNAVKAINDQTGIKVAAQARATQILLKHSQAYLYTPKQQGPPAGKPISILDMTQRKSAYQGLLAEVTAEVKAKIKTAKAGKALPPILDAVGSLTDMRALELMATDTDVESQKVADELAKQAKILMTDGLSSTSILAAQIDDDANTLTAVPSGMQRNPGRGGAGGGGSSTGSTYTKKGLTSKTTGELKEIIDTTARIATLARDFAELSKVNAAGFNDLALSAEKTNKAATTTLNANYAGIQTRK